MSKPSHKRVPFLKIIAGLAVTFGLGVGLCGVDSEFMTRFRSAGEEFGPNSFVGALGAWAIVLSAVGLILTPIVWAVVSFVTYREPEPPRTFDDGDDSNNGQPL